MSDFKVDKVGWYRRRDGGIFYVRFVDMPGQFPIVGWNSLLNVFTRKRSGRYFDNSDCQSDLVEYLPDCTGFDWVPPKPVTYRPPTLDDLGEMVEVSDDGEHWIPGALISVVCSVYKVIAYYSACKHWKFCRVIVTPSQSEKT